MRSICSNLTKSEYSILQLWRMTNEQKESVTKSSLFTRREMLGITGMAGLAALTATAVDAAPQPQQKKVRIACLVTYWAATRSHADWIICKLIDGYWWQGAHTPSRVEVVSVYIHQ